MTRIAIAGASGYTGMELCRLALLHPNLKITNVYAGSHAGKILSDVHPQFKGILDLPLESFDYSKVPEVDVLFLAVPHSQTHAYMKTLKSSPCKIIDLSADFRLTDKDAFKAAYAHTHESPELLEEIPYGLPELFFDKIKEARIVANPGCYATSVILALAPLVKANLITGTPIIDAKSGVSGAGRSLKQNTHYCEANESLSAYATGNHRHMAEMEEYTGTKVLFSPHLTPMNRGILSAIYVDLKPGVTEETLRNTLETAYKEAPFVTLMPKENVPNTAIVSGSNMCHLSVTYLKEMNKAVIFSTLDNLIKGAAGQAIQNMNIMLGFDQALGLPKVGGVL